MENPIKMDDLGGPTPILGNTQIVNQVNNIEASTCQELILYIFWYSSWLNWMCKTL